MTEPRQHQISSRQAVCDGQIRNILPHRLPENLGLELIKSMTLQTGRVPLPIIVGDATIALLASRHMEAFWPVTWLVSVIMVLILRRRLINALPKLEQFSTSQKLWILIALGAVGGVMQMLALSFFPAMPAIEKAVVSIMLLGLVVGAVASNVGYLPKYLCFALPILLPLLFLWIGNDGDLGDRWVDLVFAALITIYLGTMVSMSRDAWRLFADSWYIRTEQLELNQKLATALDDARIANQAKTRFLAAASHDLRQPVHALSIFSASLSMQELPAKAGEIAEHLEEAVGTLSEQLDALLDVSKLDASIVEPDLQPVNLAALLPRMTEEFSAQAAVRGLSYNCEAPADYWIETDPVLLQRILRNLISNAIKYTTAGNVCILLEAEHGLLTISDSGRGIPQEALGHVFEEFYQVDNPARDRSKGLGLGLAIVKRLTDLLNIGITIESTEGIGTTIGLQLPEVIEQDLSGIPQKATTAATQANAKILVIDDEAEIRLGMQTLLESMGYQVNAVGTIAEALEHSAENAPDCVLSDLRLSGNENGIDAIADLRKQVPDLPAALISGDTAPERLAQARTANLTMLHKPASASELEGLIARLLRQSADIADD